MIKQQIKDFFDAQNWVSAFPWHEKGNWNMSIYAMRWIGHKTELRVADGDFKGSKTSWDELEGDDAPLTEDEKNNHMEQWYKYLIWVDKNLEDPLAIAQVFDVEKMEAAIETLIDIEYQEFLWDKRDGWMLHMYANVECGKEWIVAFGESRSVNNVPEEWEIPCWVKGVPATAYPDHFIKKCSESKKEYMKWVKQQNITYLPAEIDPLELFRPMPVSRREGWEFLIKETTLGVILDGGRKKGDVNWLEFNQLPTYARQTFIGDIEVLDDDKIVRMKNSSQDTHDKTIKDFLAWAYLPKGHQDIEFGGLLIEWEYDVKQTDDEFREEWRTSIQDGLAE